MEPFVYTGLPSRVVFGRGTLSTLAEEAAALGIERALVICGPRQADQAERVRTALGGRGRAVFTGATMHTPVEVTAEAMDTVEAESIDGTVAIGGGSTIGLGKAIALRTDLPQIAVPTTYAGSEMTPVIGQTEAGRKTTQRTLKVLPETVVYDVDLTLTLPPALSGTSGINAIAHAVEALYAKDRNPITSLMAEEGVRALAGALPRIVDDPRAPGPRSDALYGAWLCAACLGAVGMALHHKLCHTLGGSFDLPHAETHTVVLPHATAYNAAAAPEAMAALGRALHADDPPQALFELAGAVGAPRALSVLGMAKGAVEQATAIALESPYWNPRPLEKEAIAELLARAWSGAEPAA